MVVYEDNNIAIFDWNTFAKDECSLIISGTDKEQYTMFTNLEKASGTYIMYIQQYANKNPKKEIIIKNMPLAWIPLVHSLGYKADLDTINTNNYVFGGKLEPHQLHDWTIKCEKEGTLRDLVEIMSSSDEQLADALYQLDNLRRIDLEFPNVTSIHQNNWQSYGRSYLREMHNTIIETPIEKNKLLLLPCTKSRPYYSKRTFYKAQKDNKFSSVFNDDSFLKVVVSNIGVIPEPFWEEKPVMAYSAGVPDIWLIYRMMREFLNNNKKMIDEIVCFVEFPPYIEIVEIITKDCDIPIRFEVKKKYKVKGQKFAMHGIY